MNPSPDFIPQANPAAGYHSRSEEIDRAIHRVLNSGHYILGNEVESFEREFADYLGAAYSCGVASGTDAIEIALRAGGIGYGDVVFTPSHTAVATIAAVERTGARPCFIDVDETTFTMDPDHLKQAIAWINTGTNPRESRARAIIPVHLYGHPADMPAIMDIAGINDLLVIEDCAQAHGARINGRCVGTWGDLGAFSFYPTKNLGALGDAGAVVTHGLFFANRVRQLREYGWEKRYVSRISGINSRLDELQAAVLRVNLASLGRDNDQRTRIASRYCKLLVHPALETPATCGNNYTHAYHQFVIRSERRDPLKEYLETNGIGTGIHYPVPVHQQPAYQGRVPLVPQGLAVTEKICRTILSLPMYPQLQDQDVDRICRKVLDFFLEQ